MAPVVYATNVISICAGHRLHNPNMSDEDNKRVFGKCNNVSGHGHNYKIEATVKGEVIPKYGFAINLTELKKYLVQVTRPLDHMRIDTDIEFFKQENVVATAEMIAIYIWDELSKLLPETVKLHNLRVNETDKNYIDYQGGD